MGWHAQYVFRIPGRLGNADVRHLLTKLRDLDVTLYGRELEDALRAEWSLDRHPPQPRSPLAMVAELRRMLLDDSPEDEWTVLTGSEQLSSGGGRRQLARLVQKLQALKLAFPGSEATIHDDFEITNPREVSEIEVQALSPDSDEAGEKARRKRARESRTRAQRSGPPKLKAVRPRDPLLPAVGEECSVTLKFKNQGGAAMGLKVLLVGPAIATGVVEIKSIVVGSGHVREEQRPLEDRDDGELSLTASFDRLPVLEGPDEPLTLTFTAVARKVVLRPVHLGIALTSPDLEQYASQTLAWVAAKPLTPTQS